MAKKSKKNVRLGDSDSLTDSPFASLSGGSGAGSSPPPAEVPAQDVVERLPFSVEKTRKGGWPVSVEKRRGKSVTLVDRVSGDERALLKKLQGLCSAGGSCGDGRVEVQGDHRGKVCDWLDEHVGKK